MAIASSPTVANAVEQYRRGNTELRIEFDGGEFRMLEGKRQAISTAELANIKYPTLSIGDRGEQIAILQEVLLDAGHMTGEPDGRFGPSTREAVIAFQTANGIAPDGKVGPATRAALTLPAADAWRDERVDFRTGRGYRFRYSISDKLELESAARMDTREPVPPWTRISFSEITRQPRSQWPKFLQALVRQGLRGYEVHGYGQSDFLELTFAAAEPREPLGSGRLTLSPEALRFLRISPDFPSRAPQGQDWVILVHEPHWDINGQVQLVAGLDALARANPELALEFLVEGDRPDPDCPITDPVCDIPTKPLEKLLSKDPRVKRQQIQFLLRNYLIDGPLAYRLLHRPVPALAIDDQKALNASPRSMLDAGAGESTLFFLQAELHMMDASSEAQAKILKKSKASLARARELSWQRPITAQERLARRDSLSKAVRTLASDLRSLDASSFSHTAEVLDEYAHVMAIESEITKQAIVRDKTMTDNIVAYVQRANASRIPMAFIGNAHTDGMIKLLPKHIGYVVLEPRVRNYAAGDSGRFNDALHDYPRAVAAARQNLRKLAVLPPAASFPALRELLGSVEARVLQQPKLDGAGLDAASIKAIHGAIDLNAHFNLAEVDFAGGGQPPLPPPLNHAFASFSPGDREMGSGGKLQLLPGKSNSWTDAARAAWKRKDRLNFLATVMLHPTLNRVGGGGGRTAGLFMDPDSRRIFQTLYVPEQDKYYLIDASSPMDSEEILRDPTSDLATARSLLSDLLRKLQADRS